MNESVIIQTEVIKWNDKEIKQETACWADHFAKALCIDKESVNYMCFKTHTEFENPLSNYRILTNPYKTIRDDKEFVQRMLKNSNFAKAGKIKYVLFDVDFNHPFAVVVENF